MVFAPVAASAEPARQCLGANLGRRARRRPGVRGGSPLEGDLAETFDAADVADVA